jgi:hypothetical protein
LTINTDNAIPFVQLSEPLNSDVLRASENQYIQGVALDNDGIVTRVEIDIFDLASGSVVNNGPNPVTNFAPNGAWYTTWDTSDLIHDQQYELAVKAWDGSNFSIEERIRITIDNPTDADNIVPTFNSTGWTNTITLYCDSNPTKFDRCNGGKSIDLMEHFSDADGGEGDTNGLTFDIFDDLTNLDDDNYADYVTLTPSGVAKYDPAFVTGLPDEISEWSLMGLMFEARDAYDSVAYSYKVNILVVEVSFTVVREGSGAITATNPGVFYGSGLPDSLIEARFDDINGFRLNQTRVNADSTWSMQITSSQLSGITGVREVIFEMDDQVYSVPGETGDAQFRVSLNSGDESGLNFVLIAAVIVGLLALVGAGMFFLQVEYEEFDDEVSATEKVEAEDPYAWAKARQAAVAQQQPHTAAPQAVHAVPKVVQAATPAAQHPGWIWDAEANNWVPDPNYSPDQ